MRLDHDDVCSSYLSALHVSGEWLLGVCATTSGQMTGLPPAGEVPVHIAPYLSAPPRQPGARERRPPNPTKGRLHPPRACAVLGQISEGRYVRLNLNLLDFRQLSSPRCTDRLRCPRWDEEPENHRHDLLQSLCQVNSDALQSTFLRNGLHSARSASLRWNGKNDVSASQTQRTPLQRNREDHLSSRLRASLSSATKGTGTFDELLATTCSTMRCDTRTKTPRTLPRPVEREETNVKTPRLHCTSSHTKTVEKPLVLFDSIDARELLQAQC